MCCVWWCRFGGGEWGVDHGGRGHSTPQGRPTGTYHIHSTDHRYLKHHLTCTSCRSFSPSLLPPLLPLPMRAFATLGVALPLTLFFSYPCSSLRWWVPWTGLYTRRLPSCPISPPAPPPTPPQPSHNATHTERYDPPHDTQAVLKLEKALCLHV